MHIVTVEELPLRGMSRVFVGAEQGETGVCAYLVNAPPGRGSRTHRHPYDEVSFVQSGRGRWTVDGVPHEAGPGAILVVKAGEVHRFETLGDEPLVYLSIHQAERFVQEDLD